MKKEMIFGIFALFAAMLVLTACQPTGKAGTTNYTINETNTSVNITYFCFDSDKGINENVSGYVNSSINGFNKDTCVNISMILEYYCDKYEGKYIKINCPCQNGACYQTINYTNQSITNITYTCKDSDNGNVTTVAGNVSGYYNNQFYSYSDVCNSTTIVKEWTCGLISNIGAKPYSTLMPCPTNYKCSAGKCIKSTIVVDIKD
jgi:hypothetical protein